MKEKLQMLATLASRQAAKVASHSRRYVKPAVSLLVVGGTSVAMAAAPEQPDVSDVVTFVLASAGTIALIGNARLIVAATVGVFRWVRGAIR